MNPVIFPIIGKAIDILSDVFKNKHETDLNKIQNEKIKEQNRHESDLNKDRLIKQSFENSQKNLEKSQNNEAIARQQEYEAKQSEIGAYKEFAQIQENKNKEMLRHSEALLESKMDNTEKYLNKMMEIKEAYLDEKQHILNSLYDERDESFNQALTVMDNIIDDGIDAFNDCGVHREVIEEIKGYKILISEKNKEFNDELIVIRSDLSRLKTDLIKEEARYDQIIALKYSLNNNDFKRKFDEVSTSMLEIANKLNDKEIYLIKKVHEKSNSDEKLMIINNQLRSIERKEFDALSSLKASFYAQKIINNMSFSKVINSNGNVEFLENDKLSYPLNDTIDVKIQSNNMKRLEH